MSAWLISQRLDIDRHGSTVDVLEHAYLDFFAPRVGRLIPVSNHAGMTPDVRDHSGLIVTGGGDLPRARLAGAADSADGDALAIRKFDVQSALVREALGAHTPVIAICYGFQMLNLVLGGVVQWDVHGGAADRRPGQPHTVRAAGHCPIPIAAGGQVNSFHNQGIAKGGLATDLEALVLDEGYDVVEAARHRTPPLLALQWHPERPGPQPNLGAALIDEFLDRVRPAATRR